ncbi:MAG: polysaccharide biosynthesis protein [Alphaproteobacteria bacterium]|nr:polysaccharide biosynthesis protein [Alphaproteobacteria bacterium]
MLQRTEKAARKVAFMRLVRFTGIISLDAGAVALSFFLAFELRLQGALPPALEEALPVALPTVIILSVIAFYVTGLYHRAWRYVSIGDLFFLTEAATLAVAMSFGTLLLIDGAPWLPASIPIIQWFVLIVLLGGMRVVRRVAREAKTRFSKQGNILPVRQATRDGVRSALLLGDPDWANMLISALQRDATADMNIMGIMTHDGRDANLRLRGVPMLGSPEVLKDIVDMLDQQGRRPNCLIVNQNDPMLIGPQMVKLVNKAEQLGLDVARAPDPAGLQHQRKGKIDLQFLNLTDLLDRQELKLDKTIVRETVSGCRIMVTGAGGTIGSELVRQLAAFGPDEIVLIDHAEYNLYAIDMEMREKFPGISIIPELCCIRQRDPIMQLFAQHRPELVFHAAALKHVPLVEGNPCAGVQTNVLGTRNVADAVRKYGARAMVQVSTDKAVNPVGMMGTTKRLGELYAQALDLEGAGDAGSARFMTVRFGNVLGSSGSLIPLFQRQLSRHGPLTVTHPDIERYFMTVQEAVQLILQSSTHALRGDVDHGRIFVLDMGKPIKIMDIAKRMIRLAGLEPEVDVEIRIVGLRPGEKLYEELFDQSEEQLPSALPGIFEARSNPVPLATLNEMFNRLDALAQAGNDEALCSLSRAILDQVNDQVIGQLDEPVHMATISAIKHTSQSRPASSGHFQGAV